MKLVENNDAYAFGVILSELIAGRAITTDNEVSVIKDLVSTLACIMFFSIIKIC